MIRSAQVLKQEAENIGLERKEIAEYAKNHQPLDREERAAWKDAHKIQADVQMAQINADEKRRADEIQKAQISVDLDKPRIDADKELALREMELKTQAQASTNATVDPSPHSRDAKSPKLPAFMDKKAELDSYLLRFVCYAENAIWEKVMCAIKCI